MPMSDGTNMLKKIAFQLGDRFFRFAINPHNMQYANPHRTTAVKTKSRIILEDFQNDIPTVTIQGTTGFNPTGASADKGIAKIKEMKAFLENYALMGGNGNTSAEDLYFHDFTNDESYVVHLSPEGVAYTQDVSQPLLHQYEIKFIILRKSTEPADDEVVSPQIGNSVPSVGSSVGITVQSPYVPSNGVTSPEAVPTTPNVIYPNSSGSSGSTTGSSNSSSGSSSSSSGTTNSGSSTPNTGTYDPTSGNSNIYNSGTNGAYTPPNSSLDPVNPQVPSINAYQYGMTGLGFIIGYYGRSY